MDIALQTLNIWKMLRYEKMLFEHTSVHCALGTVRAHRLIFFKTVLPIRDPHR